MSIATARAAAARGVHALERAIDGASHDAEQEARGADANKPEEHEGYAAAVCDRHEGTVACGFQQVEREEAGG